MSSIERPSLHKGMHDVSFSVDAYWLLTHPFQDAIKKCLREATAMRLAKLHPRSDVKDKRIAHRILQCGGWWRPRREAQRLNVKSNQRFPVWQISLHTSVGSRKFQSMSSKIKCDKEDKNKSRITWRKDANNQMSTTRITNQYLTFQVPLYINVDPFIDGHVWRPVQRKTALNTQWYIVMTSFSITKEKWTS